MGLLGLSLLACAVVRSSPAAAAQAVGQGALVNGNGAARAYPIDPDAAPRPHMRAIRTDQQIRIDGRLDEPAWLLADSATRAAETQKYLSSAT
jgi:hypothetical protein